MNTLARHTGCTSDFAMKLLPLMLATTAGCAATTVDYARLGPPRPRPSYPAMSVAVLFREPTCTFEEIGMLEITPGAYGSSLQEQIDLMRGEAGARGANGIILIGHNDTASDHHQNTIRHAYTALAIDLDPMSCEGLTSRTKSLAAVK